MKNVNKQIFLNFVGGAKTNGYTLIISLFHL